MAPRRDLEALRKLERKLADGADVEPPLEANYSNVKDPMSDPFFGYYARRFAREEAPRVTERVATLDALLSESGIPVVDCLKIDTDGYDFDVLGGAEKTLSNGCLAVEVEIQFHGRISRQSNTFCNIDGFLRERGFYAFQAGAGLLCPRRTAKSFLTRYSSANQGRPGSLGGYLLRTRSG